MQLGIDLGTTRTVVAASDRGNYPVIGFETPTGDVVDHVPTVTAELDGRLVHGHTAVAAAREGAPALRSWKRLLPRGGPEQRVRIGRVELPLLELCSDFLQALARSLVTASNLPSAGDALPAVVASVPANAHSGQRFMTLEAFRRAGFEVRALINEPSAAAIEYAHRYRGSLNRRRDHVAVYDLGGGTFDAALVSVAGDGHEVIDAVGVQQLGGDDFDDALLAMVLERLGDVSGEERQRLREQCCAAKEAISPTSRRIAIDLDVLERGPVVIAVEEYYRRVRPLVQRTVEVLSQVLRPTDGAGGDDLKQLATESGVAGLYVVGGASGLPLVPRFLKELVGRRVHRSAYPSASTAIGLAVFADHMEAQPLRERFARHLGVFREGDAGDRVVFDSIFARGTPMPSAAEPPVSAVRRYRAAHNVGHFRFVECTSVDPSGEPSGDISPHERVVFPFLSAEPEPDAPAVVRVGNGPWIEERYQVDAAGVVAVVIENLDAGYSRRFVLRQPSG